MQQVQSIQRWASTDGTPSRTRMALVGQAVRQRRQSRHSSATTASDKTGWATARSGCSSTLKRTVVPLSTTLSRAKVSELLRILGRPRPAPKAQGARFGGSGRPARRERLLEVGDAGPFVDHVDVEAALVEGRLEAPAVGVDDDVHLGFVGGDHGAADGVGARPDRFEMGLDGARGGARLVVVAALDVVADVLHRGAQTRADWGVAGAAVRDW